MGAGRKTETYNPSTPTQHQTNTRWYGNQSVSARNLREDKLGGIIFGCTHKTIDECLSKQLFGLPAGHWSYVKNVKPGLPLFLFNYSNRKLHGIFEAATSGQLAIDQFAWSGDGRTETQFPAQVRVSTKTQCLPLLEDKYKSVISGNYYNLGHFYFELDRAQTRALISLFIPAPVRAVPNKRSSSGPAPVRAVPNKRSSSGPAPVRAVPNKWSFSGSLRSPMRKAHLVPGQVKIESDSLDVVNQFGVSSHSRDMVPYNLADQDTDYANASRTSKSNLDEASDWNDLDDGATKEGLEFVNDDHQHINPVHHKQHDTMAVGQKLQGLSLLQQEEAQPSEDAVDFSSDKSTLQQALGAAFPKDPFNAALEGDAPAKDNTSFKRRHGNAEVLQIINELSKKIEAMEKNQIVSDQEIFLLKESVKNTERRVQQLEYQFEKLPLEYNSSATLLARTRDNVEGPSIFLIGGHDGITWLSSLDSFCPTTDRLEPLRPMSSARGYAAVAALKDHVFVFGGGNGSSWYNTVECYNRGNNEWITCPSLKREKGSLAGATLNDKIFAIGGGDGLQIFSEVEMFDPTLGSWIYSPSMQKCRFTPAAAELNGILYVVGGFDGNKSAERYDPREGFWAELPSMKTRRGSHSVAVLGEALYALGGHTGKRMLSTVEIFDPRASSWRIGSPFSVPRGYGCASTLNDNVYLIGGVQLNEESVETVEVYNEKQGWSIPGYSAIGKRAFASAIVV